VPRPSLGHMLLPPNNAGTVEAWSNHMGIFVGGGGGLNDGRDVV
jgi:hypothetical protein